MAIKPILFNTEMVRAILDGKTSMYSILPGLRTKNKMVN